MSLLLLCIATVLLVAVFSRDHELASARDTVVAAELNLDAAALSVFPGSIHLARCSRTAFSHHRLVRTAAAALRSDGFDDAGSYALLEFPGVHVVLAANTRESMYAVVVDHPRAGVWIDVVSRYLDGTRWMHTTLTGRGLEARPETTVTRLPGATIAELLARARGDRPRDGLRKVNRVEVAPHFEQGYADWIAWRKRQQPPSLVMDGDAEPSAHQTESRAA
jgi:hypothetical protein